MDKAALSRDSVGVSPIEARLICLLDIGRWTLADMPAAAEMVRLGGVTLAVALTAGAAPRAVAERLKLLRSALGPDGPPLIVSGRVDMALAIGLDGVHLGQDDLQPNDTRRVLGERGLVGIDLHTPAQADELFRWRVDYAIVSESGAGRLGSAVEADMLSRIAFRIRLAAPGTAVVAMSGPEPLTAARAIEAGADGVAMMSAHPAEGHGMLSEIRASIDRAFPPRGAAR
jgi:thiamine-phosphate pyrophosphorylase